MKNLFIIIAAIVLAGCAYEEKTDEATPEAKVLSLTFLLSDNPSLNGDISGVIDEEAKEIAVAVNADTEVEPLRPTVVLSDGATSNIGQFTPMDINSEYTVEVSNQWNRVDYKIRFYRSATLVTAVKVNGVESYYNAKDETYYAPLVRELWGGAVDIEVKGVGITSYTIGSLKTEYGKTATIGLSMNQEYEIRIDGDKPTTAKLIVTGLPIIILESELPMTSLSNQSKTECTVSLIDPEKEGKRNHHDLNGVIRVRGNSSSYYDKKSLALELRDQNGVATIDKAFLNMRSDDDWILDAMYMEQLRMRNRVSHDIWLDMHKPHYAAKEPKALSTNRGEMAEMFYNGEYMGIYCVSEKVDRKQQKLNDVTGGLYKGESWGEECILKSCWYGYTDPFDDYFGGWQIQHPTEPNNWQPLLDFLKFAIESDYRTGTSSTFGKEIGNRVVMDNIVDFILHLNIVNGTDNTGRNTFLSVYDTNGSGDDPKFFYTPWDMDATFGTDWLYQKVDPNLFLGLKDVDVPSERTYGNYMLMKIAKYDIGDFGSKIRQRWAELRADQASDRKLTERFESYYNILNNSGAYARETKRWGKNYQSTFGVSYNPAREIEYLKTWIPKHMQYVDTYIQNWDKHAAGIVIK